jgi:two-component system, chemotaxis family, chemotaxis protein CheY
VARILVIDDENPIRRMLRAALEMEGHEVFEACHGDEALRLHRTTPADLVITDMIMPLKDGLEVIMALRREAPEVRVIAMSGGGRFMMMEPLQMAEPLGAFATLRKPFELDAMIETVRRALAA